MNSVWMVEEKNRKEDSVWQATGISETVRETARAFKRALQKVEGDTIDFRIIKYIATSQRG